MADMNSGAYGIGTPLARDYVEKGRQTSGEMPDFFPLFFLRAVDFFCFDIILFKNRKHHAPKG